LRLGRHDRGIASLDPGIRAGDVVLQRCPRLMRLSPGCFDSSPILFRSLTSLGF
jgi:hypothetical protein